MKWYFFQHDKRKKFPVMKLINLLFPRQSQLILTPYSSLVKVSFYLVSAIGKLKVGKKLPNFGFVTNIRSCRPEVFCKKGVLRNFAKSTGKHLCQKLFFNKIATLLKKSLWHRCFPVNFEQFLKKPFLQDTSGGCFLHKET